VQAVKPLHQPPDPPLCCASSWRLLGLLLQEVLQVSLSLAVRLPLLRQGVVLPAWWVPASCRQLQGHMCHQPERHHRQT
jgi:hypothetical protein